MTTRHSYHTNLKQISKGDRRFVISIDGTGNDPSDADEAGAGVTNVRRFHTAIDCDDANQYPRYFPGVGTDQRNGGGVSTLFGKAFGAGAKALCEEAYIVLVTNYRPGDRIFVTGFSRGAAIARMLCNLIHKQGIPETITIIKNGEGRIVGYENRGKKTPVKIEILGVWDTVASFGVPVDLGPLKLQRVNLFTNLTIAPNIKKAYHAVSVDENRDAFTPTLMNHDPRRIEEIWFPGVHADVGGGYDMRRLADVALEYMIGKARRLGLKFNEDALSEIQPNPDGLGVLHRHAERIGDFNLSPRKISVMKGNKVSRKFKIKLHESLFRRTDALTKARYDPKNVKTAMNHPFSIVKRNIAD